MQTVSGFYNRQENTRGFVLLCVCRRFTVPLTSKWCNDTETACSSLVLQSNEKQMLLLDLRMNCGCQLVIFLWSKEAAPLIHMTFTTSLPAARFMNVMLPRVHIHGNPPINQWLGFACYTAHE